MLGFVIVIQKRVRIGGHVPVVQKRVLGESDVDEGRLQVVLQVLDAALEHAADETLLFGVLHHVFLEPSVLKHGDARLQFLDVDDDFALQLRALEPAKQIHLNSSL